MKKSKWIIFLLGLLIIKPISAQLEDINPEYLSTLNKRATKIIESLNIEDQDKTLRVQEIIVIQYYELSKIHDARDAKLKEIDSLEAEEKENAKRLIQNETDSKFYALHASYLAKLSSELDQPQVEKVKDGMTYGVVERTYNGYLNLLPDLTGEQKRYIYRNLVEARELAMDAGSSKAKHAWFGKYKGRINNYLSAAGYDLKKSEQELKEKKKK